MHRPLPEVLRRHRDLRPRPALLHHAWEFFGPERTLFGSDTPYERTPGAFVIASRSSVAAMPISDEHKGLIYGGNVRRLLGRP